MEEEGLELVDVEYVKEGADYYLRVFIDRLKIIVSDWKNVKL